MLGSVDKEIPAHLRIVCQKNQKKHGGLGTGVGGRGDDAAVAISSRVSGDVVWGRGLGKWKIRKRQTRTGLGSKVIGI